VEKQAEGSSESTIRGERDDIDFKAYARFLDRIVNGRFPLLRRFMHFFGFIGTLYRLTRRSLKSKKLNANLAANISNLNKLLLYVQNVAYQ
jgi:hypothetical protein